MMSVHSKGSTRLRLQQTLGMPEQRHGNKQDGVEIAGPPNQSARKALTARSSIYFTLHISLSENQLQLVQIETCNIKIS